MGTETGYFATLGLSAGSLSTRSKSSSAAMRLIQIAQLCRAPPHLTQAHTELYRRAANLALTVKQQLLASQSPSVAGQVAVLA